MSPISEESRHPEARPKDLACESSQRTLARSEILRLWLRMTARFHMAQRIVVGARGSALSRAQTAGVVQALRAAYGGALEIVTEVIVTTGDVTLDKPLPEIGGKGLFTAELDRALRDGAIDIAVHALKDLPIDADALDAELILGAICERGSVDDVLIAPAGWTLATLPAGARVGTSSLRRQMQLIHARPDVIAVSIRGNIDTRIRKCQAGDYDAIILASCGLERLGLRDVVTQTLPLDTMLPAPGQGAIAVQCRRDAPHIRALLATIDHTSTRKAVLAERAFLAGLGGGCSLPVAAWAHEQGSGLTLRGRVCGAAGAMVIDVNATGKDPLALGHTLARQALAQGAGELLP